MGSETLYRNPNDRKTNVPERKKVEKVISGTAKVKKKSGALKLMDIFLPEDITDVKSYILIDLLVPAVKNLISDTVDTLLFNGKRGGKRGTVADRISYTNYYDRRGRRVDNRPRNGYMHDPVIVDTRHEADEVISRMYEILDQYGMVSVGDMYDLVGVTIDYTANKYGWTNLNSASVQRTRDGYMIKMPKAMPID